MNKPMQNIFYSTCPIVGDELTKIVRMADIGGQGKTEPVEFDTNILWLRESESTIEFRHAGHLLKHGSTYNDFYGLLTSVPSVIEEACRIIKHFEVTPESTMEIVAIVRIQDIPALKSLPGEEEGRRRPYCRMPSDWCRGTKDALIEHRAAQSRAFKEGAKLPNIVECIRPKMVLEKEIRVSKYPVTPDEGLRIIEEALANIESQRKA